MRRTGTMTCVLPIVLLLSLVTGLAATTAAASAHGTTRRTLSGRSHPATWPRTTRPYDATLVGCRNSLRLEPRAAVVGASMRPIPGARRLALRIDLYQRLLGDDRWLLRADVPGLGVWTSPSDPTIGRRPKDVFKSREAVTRLVAPYAYRFKVTFRWLDASGRIVREESTLTPPCRQSDLRPDLVLARVRVEPGSTGDVTTSARYVLLVRNVGHTAAFGITVAAAPTTADPSAPATEPLPSRTLRRLAPHEWTEVTLPGPGCVAGSEPTFVVDPENAIDEARESDNALSATCPATLGGP